MTTEQVIGLALVLLLMGIGLVGSVLHVLPGAPLICLVAVGHRLYFGPTGASTWVLVVMAGVALWSMLIDVLASVIGARTLGATRRGMWGAVVGGLVGLFFSLPGLLLGPFLGAFVLERSGGRTAKQAAKAGLGAVLGFWIGAVANFASCLVMIVLFVTSVLVNSFAHKSAETIVRIGGASQVCGVPLDESFRLQQTPVLLLRWTCAVRNDEHRLAGSARKAIS